MKTIKLFWRGWHLCPLLDIGKCTLWFTKGKDVMMVRGQKVGCGLLNMANSG